MVRTVYMIRRTSDDHQSYHSVDMVWKGTQTFGNWKKKKNWILCSVATILNWYRTTRYRLISNLLLDLSFKLTEVLPKLWQFSKMPSLVTWYIYILLLLPIFLICRFPKRWFHIHISHIYYYYKYRKRPASNHERVALVLPLCKSRVETCDHKKKKNSW
jgi:hypothetical protein